VTDPWRTFAATAADRDEAGYFEIGPARRAGTGRAVWFTRAREVLRVSPVSSPRALAARVERHLSSAPGRAAMGFLGFDAVGLFEPCLRSFPNGDPFPLGAVALVDRPSRGLVPPRPRLRPVATGPPARPISDSLPLPRFGRSVRRLIEEIRDGEAYQVVLAHRRAWRRPADLLTRAGALRAAERYAFFFYLRLGDLELAGASPESVVEVEGRRAYINPIAGTIPRGVRAGRRLPLAIDPKELAEHRMLVDLARNDLGAVASAGTVRLVSRERIERFARLEHIVTRVRADLPRGVGPWEVLGSTFPAGTVSGAPKIRATELLRREEASWRGPYAGTVGLLEPGGRATWALAIRTGFAVRDRLYTAAGAGIVQHSEPLREFHETLTKLALVESALVGGPS